MSSRFHQKKKKKKLHANYYINKEAWKNFFIKTTIQINNSFSTTLKTTKKYSSSVLTYIRRRFLHVRRNFLKYPRRQYSSYPANNFYPSSTSNMTRAIYIDELFPAAEQIKKYDADHHHHSINGSSSSSSGALIKPRDGNDGSSTMTTTAAGETSRSRKVGKNTVMMTWRGFRGVDERAEEFINKFREEMKIEREKSIIDFQEMLARSS